MKKFLLSSIALAILALNQGFAQCTPGSINVDFQPAVGSTLSAGAVGQSYSETIYLKAPASLEVDPSSLGLPAQLMLIIGSLPSISVDVVSMNVTSVSGLPAGV